MNIIIKILYPLKDAIFLSGILLSLRCAFRLSRRKGKIILPLVYVFTIAVIETGVCFPQGYLTSPYEILDFVSFLIYIMSGFIVFQRPPKLKTFAFVLISVSTVDMLWAFFSSVVLSELSFDEEIIAECIFYTAVGAAISVLMILLTKKHCEGALSRAVEDMPPWLPGCLFFFELSCFYREFGMSIKIYRVLFSISACLLLSCIIYLAVKVSRLCDTQNEILKRLNEQVSYAEDRSKNESEVRAFRHELKNHFITLGILFQNGEYEKAYAYFDNLSGQSNAVLSPKKYQTGNEIADSLMSVKSAEAEIEFSGTMPKNFVSSADMCIILGNLLDNAVRACNEYSGDNKKISIVSRVQKGGWVMSVKNPVNDFSPEKHIYKKLSTTKADGKNHGFGITNVQNTLKKYGGSLELYTQNGFFTADLLILNGGKTE